MNSMQIKREGNMKIIISDDAEISLTSQSVEANLLYAILSKLEEIRCGLIDIETNTAKIC